MSGYNNICQSGWQPVRSIVLAPTGRNNSQKQQQETRVVQLCALSSDSDNECDNIVVGSWRTISGAESRSSGMVGCG